MGCDRQTDLEKFARFCTTLAMRVSVRDVCSSGYSCVRLKSDGDMMAGHRKRRKREPLMRRSAMSSRPRSAQRTLQEANTSFSSRGKTLRGRGGFKEIPRGRRFIWIPEGHAHSPMGVDDLAERQLAAHSEVGLVVREHGGRRSRGVHLAVLLRLVQGSYELPYGGLTMSNSTAVKAFPTLAFPVLCRMCTSAHATSSLLLTLSTGSSTAHSVR
ncbi:hypothetical protein EYF80_006492 [Liparis tanakae]|uniref:Uncharacterized protein n=1 Tax=Liparis tanakae TaxID=230148 RepID=A0A4Z2IYU1_9TELE|nr:hypothetical protein EYF80_006492 [Liparis tanakae]